MVDYMSGHFVSYLLCLGLFALQYVEMASLHVLLPVYH